MQSLICLLFTVLGAYAPFTERGQVDFDIVLESLRTSGSWIKVDEGYAFLPKAAESDANWAPFRDGRWTYTDRGWMFEAINFESWITTHYGYWQRWQGKWVWMPQGYWQPATVAWVASGDYIGWYPIKMGPLGELLGEINVEKLPPEGWSLIPLAQFGSKMNSGSFASPSQARELLAKAIPSYHKIKMWREVEYAGPAPADIEKLSGKGFKTRTLKTLPAVDAEHPPELPDEYYLFRPKFFQDNDGIQKRIEIFLKKLKGDTIATPKVRAAMGIEELEGQKPASKSQPEIQTSEPAPTPIAPTLTPTKTSNAAVPAQQTIPAAKEDSSVKLKMKDRGSKK